MRYWIHRNVIRQFLKEPFLHAEIPEADLLTEEYSKLNQTRKIDKNAFDMMAYSVRLFER